MINVKDVITLSDDKKYCVTSKTIYEGTTYYLLIDIDDFKNVKICSERIDNGTIKLTQINDIGLQNKIMLLFGKNAINKNYD